MDPSDTLPTVEKLASELGWDGQMSLDFVDTDDGLMMIECNPRPTDGVLLMTAEELERGLAGADDRDAADRAGPRAEQLDFAVFGQIFREPLQGERRGRSTTSRAFKGTDRAGTTRCPSSTPSSPSPTTSG